MKKKTIKAIAALSTSREERNCFICYDNQEKVIIAGNNFAGVMFTDVTDSDREELEKLPHFGENQVSIAKFFENFMHHYHDFYDDDQCMGFKISDVQEEIKKVKAGKRRKSYSDNGWVMYDKLLEDNFGVTYNKELLLDVMNCLEAHEEYKVCNIAFPKNRKHPIIVSGKYGYGIVMPCIKRK